MAIKKEEKDFCKKEVLDNFQSLPKRKLSEMEKQVIFILIEKAKIERERSMALLNKGFFIFLFFILLAFIQRLNDPGSSIYVYILFIFGMIMFIIIVITYYSSLSNEKKTLDNLLDSFLK